MYSLRALGSALLCLGFVLTAGCGGTGKYGVSGTVQYKGAPVKTGTVSFIPDGGTAPAGGAPIVNGSYEIPAAVGLPVGNYKVSISSAESKAVAKADEPPGESGPAPKELLPAKYNASTELKAEVKAIAKNVFDYDLK
jgi:hypothetical protein